MPIALRFGRINPKADVDRTHWGIHDFQPVNDSTIYGPRGLAEQTDYQGRNTNEPVFWLAEGNLKTTNARGMCASLSGRQRPLNCSGRKTEMKQ